MNIQELLIAENKRLQEELRCESIDNAAVCQNLRDVISEYHDHLANRDQKIKQLEEELVGLRRLERRWHKLLSESEPSQEFLSGEAFRSKEQSDKEKS